MICSTTTSFNPPLFCVLNQMLSCNRYLRSYYALNKTWLTKHSYSCTGSWLHPRTAHVADPAGPCRNCKGRCINWQWSLSSWSQQQVRHPCLLLTWRFAWSLSQNFPIRCWNHQQFYRNSIANQRSRYCRVVWPGPALDVTSACKHAHGLYKSYCGKNVTKCSQNGGSSPFPFEGERIWGMVVVWLLLPIL